MNKMYVYGLYDVLDEALVIVYVGLTSSIRQRKLNHSGHSKRAVGQWIKSIRAQGSDLGLKVLEVTNEKDGLKREDFWIERLKPQFNVNRLREGQPPAIGMRGMLAELQMKVILETLEKCGGNKKLTAETLGIGRQTLYNRLGTR